MDGKLPERAFNPSDRRPHHGEEHRDHDGLAGTLSTDRIPVNPEAPREVPAPRVALCRSCNRPLRWIATATSRGTSCVAIDPEPQTDGLVVDIGGLAVILSPERAGTCEEPRFRLHS